jgi:hypothetical protein
LALLNNAYVKSSPQLMREYVPIAVSAQINHSDALHTQQHTIDIPCVRVEIPQRDWNQIVQLIQAHERAIKHPAVENAWDQYLMLCNLIDLDRPNR